MTSALAVDGTRGPELPAEFRRPQPHEQKSPLPTDWSDAAKPLREAVEQLEELFGGR